MDDDDLPLSLRLQVQCQMQMAEGATCIAEPQLSGGLSRRCTSQDGQQVDGNRHARMSPAKFCQPAPSRPSAKRLDMAPAGGLFALFQRVEPHYREARLGQNLVDPLRDRGLAAAGRADQFNQHGASPLLST